jgi:hypothetical protein
MVMPARRTPRSLALFALALALFAALPCATLAGDDSCCAVSAVCGDASEAPCAQLTATPCCESRGGAPLELTASVNPTPAPVWHLTATALGWDGGLALDFARFAPSSLHVSDRSIRTVILRL